MDWSPYVSGALNLAGSVFSGLSSKRNSDAAWARQIGWERERAQHAHQWEVADLKAAGLNPILSATGGSGANTSAISSQPIDTPNFGESLTSGVNSAKSLQLQKLANEANIQKIQSEKEVNDEQIRVSQLNNTVQMYQASLDSKIAYATQTNQQARLIAEEANQLAERAGLIAIQYAQSLQLLENSKDEGARIRAQTNLSNLNGQLTVLQGLYTVAQTDLTRAGIAPAQIDAEYQSAFKGHPLLRRAVELGGNVVSHALGGALPFLLGKAAANGARGAAIGSARAPVVPKGSVSVGNMLFGPLIPDAAIKKYEEHTGFGRKPWA